MKVTFCKTALPSTPRIDTPCILNPTLAKATMAVGCRWTVVLATAASLLVGMNLINMAVLTKTTDADDPTSQQVHDLSNSAPQPAWNIDPRVPPRKWYANHSVPCYDPVSEGVDAHWTDSRLVQKKPTDVGFLFLKLTKTGSSTAAGIHLRIATAEARRQQLQSDICRVRYLHGWAGPRMYRFGERNRTESFLWTIVREPSQRYLSEFFHFEHARLGRPAEDAIIIQFLRHGRHANHHSIMWLSTSGYHHGHDDPHAKAAEILANYDFVAVTERLHESLVVLQLLLDIPLADILYISSKQSGGYDDGAFRDRCFAIPPANVSSGIKDYLASDEWRDYIAPEVALYNAADASLTATIEMLGVGRVQAQVWRLERALELVHQRCKPRLPCDEQGHKRNETDCLWSDLGCGFDCLDAIADELHLT